MSVFSKHNPCLRKFPSVSAIGVSLENRRVHESVRGTPYKPLDRFSVWLLWSTALFVALILYAMNPWLVVPWILAGAPISVGVACLLARMVNRDWFSLTVGIGYLVLTIGGLLVIPIWI